MKTNRMLQISLALYRLLLRLYPETFRREYGHQMVQTFRDQCRDAVKHGIGAWARLWKQTFADAVITILREHMESRKVPIMSKNRPDGLSSLLFLIPGALLSMLYLMEPTTVVRGDKFVSYVLAGGLGLAGFILARTRLIRRTQLWEQFLFGLVLGAACFIAFFIWSPSANLGIAALRSQPWPKVRLVIHFVVILAGILWLGSRVKSYAVLYRAAAGILLVNGLIQAVLPVGPSDDFLHDLTWAWSYSATILGVVVFRLAAARRQGIQALVAVLIGLGVTATLNVGDHSGSLAQLILLLTSLFPLVICPAWLLLAPTWRSKKYGVLISWGIMLVGIVLASPLYYALLDPADGNFRLVHMAGNITACIPLLVGLWLALRLYEKQYIEPAHLNPLPSEPVLAKA